MSMTLDPNEIPVWLDCDPGHDDCFALLLAGYSPKINLLGVSTVAGNQSVEKTTENARRFLDAAGLEHVEVARGQKQPLLRSKPMLCPEIHGETGLDSLAGGSVLEPAKGHFRTADCRRAVPRMFDVISQHYVSRQQTVRLVATGALTNIALLLSLYDEVIDMVQVVIMGGSMGAGNTGPVQEFNIQTDPEAAKVVFDLASVVMVPLEVTHKALVTPGVLARLCPDDASRFRILLRELLLFFKTTYKNVFGFEDPPLHDPCAVAYVIAPHLFKTKRMRVDIEISSSLCSGQTVCDIWHQSGKAANAEVALDMNISAFWELIICAADAADSARNISNFVSD